MHLAGDALLLRVFIGERDRCGHTPLHEAIIKRARALGLAGATAWRGVLSYGRSARVRTAGVLDLSADLPLIIEIVDQEEAIRAFLPVLDDLIESARCGGLVTYEKVNVIKYAAARERTGAHG